MNPTTGPKWVVSTAISIVATLGLAVIGWSALPVESKSGDYSLEVKLRPFTSVYDVSVDKTLSRDDSMDLNCFPPIPILKCDGADWMKMFPQKSVKYGVVATPAHPLQGLHRTKIRIEDAEREIWILNIGPRTFAIK